MEKDELNERRQSLISEKKALLSRLKKINSRANYKRYEVKVLQTIIKGKPRPDVRALKRWLNRLEFRIETESSSLQMERQMMKQINRAKKEFEAALKTDRQFRKLSYLEADILESEKELNSIEQELQETNKAINDIGEQLSESRTQQAKAERAKAALRIREKRKKERKEVQNKENAHYTEKLESTVSLEDICVIHRKEEKKPK